MSRPPLPPFNRETAAQKPAWPKMLEFTRPRTRGARLYGRSRWRKPLRNFRGPRRDRGVPHPQMAKGARVSLIKDLWAFDGNRIAVRFQYECMTMPGSGIAPTERAVGVRPAWSCHSY